MKKTLLLALAFAALTLSCSKPEPDGGVGGGNGYVEQVEDATVRLSATEVTLGGSKLNTSEVTVSTNQSKITATTEDTWMTVKMMGRILIIEATEANETGESRDGSVIVTVGEGENTATASLTVTQTIRDAASEEQLLQITSEPADMEADAGSSTFVTFKTNQSEISLTFSSDVSEWLTYEIVDGKIIFTTLTKNISGAKRRVSVTVMAGTAAAAPFTLQQHYEIVVPHGLVLGALYEEGMIFEIGPDYVKILSLDEEKLVWASEAMSSRRLGTDKDAASGEENTAKIIADKQVIGDYPAAEWCVGHGEDWYMPSRQELYTIYDNLLKEESVRERTQYLVVKYGGVEFNLGYYHTCSEYPDESKNETYVVRLSDKGVAHYGKTSSRYVRAVRKITIDVAEELDKVDGELGDFGITEETWTNN